MFQGSAVRFRKSSNAALGDILAVDFDALGKGLVMRTNVQACFEARLLTQSRQQVADRAFAVGAPHVNGRESGMGLTEVCTQRQRIGQVFFIGRRANALKHWQLLVQIIERGGKGHFSPTVMTERPT